MLEHLIGISLKGFKVASFRFIIHRLTFAPLAVSKTLIAPHPDEFAREERVARDKSWEEEEREGVTAFIHANVQIIPTIHRGSDFLDTSLSFFFLSFFLYLLSHHKFSSVLFQFIIFFFSFFDIDIEFFLWISLSMTDIGMECVVLFLNFILLGLRSVKLDLAKFRN